MILLFLILSYIYIQIFDDIQMFTINEGLVAWVKTTSKRHNLIVVMKHSDFFVKDMVNIGVRIPTTKMKRGRDIELLEQKSVDVGSL